ncbi:Mth938-like domain-containing protein [Basilea psittacipulmonis]|uniref:Xcc1710-like domain-containing protein n=1 Tax=Basilea psittacipulmonis DSM 24701 TaxID=1072685 RepID=A0A077DD83_9BURK|nr:MTH938/NDUFAF3 family protein [Basilea psittacipulmonis]AIL32795.1 hypothetical protein IX83_05240 [Basilea psittacipulmonis DSM 24701]
MLLQQELTPHLNTITAYGNGFIEINAQKFHQPVFLRPNGNIQEWNIRSLDDINLDMLEKIAGVTHASSDVFDFLEDQVKRYENGPELMIIGTGKTQRFLPLHITAPFLQSRIGIETMDSQAAARTYNILMSEGRDIVLALFIE